MKNLYYIVKTKDDRRRMLILLNHARNLEGI